MLILRRKKLSQGDIISKWWSWDVTPGSLPPDLVPFPTVLLVCEYCRCPEGSPWTRLGRHSFREKKSSKRGTGSGVRWGWGRWEDIPGKEECYCQNTEAGRRHWPGPLVWVSCLVLSGPAQMHILAGSPQSISAL